ncbi:MAG: hypothetical protein V1853_05120 [bacterium]
MNSTKTSAGNNQPAQPAAAPANPHIAPTRLFRNWWLVDIRKTWPALLMISVIGIGVNALIFTVALVYLPNLFDLFFARSLSGLFQAGLNIIGSPWLCLILIFILAIVNVSLIGWITVALYNKITEPGSGSGQAKNKLLKLFYVAAIALIILLAISVIGTALAYGFSRWYFGVVIPLLLLTALLLLVFSVWFSFLPFIVIWEGISGTPALSLSRQRARKSAGRIILITLVTLLIPFFLYFELNGLPVWLKLALLALIIPVYASLLASLYSEARSRGLIINKTN